MPVGGVAAPAVTKHQQAESAAILLGTVVAVAGKKGANISGASTTAGEAAAGADATGATDRAGGRLSNRGLEAIGTEMYGKDRQYF